MGNEISIDFSVLDDVMIDIDGREMPFSFRSYYEGTMSALKKPYLQSGNPLFVWAAIRKHHIFEALVRAEADPNWPQWSGAMPAWCSDYLIKCADEVRSLGRVLFRDTPANRNERPPANAANRVSAAFGFTRKGWSAFNEVKAFGKACEAVDALAKNRQAGGSSDEAIYQTSVDLGISERQVQRRIARQRGRAGARAATALDDDTTSA